MIPMYNPDLGYLEETLRSVLDQDPGADQMQIELLDDGSPNPVRVDFIRKIVGDRVAIHIEPRNLGLAKIWNRCIERASGEWIHILHQDDLVLPGFYKSLRRGIETHPQVGAAFCRQAYGDENGHWRRMSVLEMSSPGVLQNFVEPLISQERILCASIVVKKSTYEVVGGFNPGLTHALDWEMWIRIANQFAIFYEPKILACWRNHSNATTSRQIRSGEDIRDIRKAIGIWSRYLPEADRQRLTDAASRRFAYEGLSLARYLLRQNDIPGSLNQMNAALSCKKSPQILWQASKIRIKAMAKKILSRQRDQSNLAATAR
jgi:glycosyltransferase involved in cell wall biosynthesis